MATIKIPRAMSTPRPSGAPINKPASIVLSHSYALGLNLKRASAEMPSTSLPQRVFRKTVMRVRPFISAPSEPRFWASQGPCFCLAQPRPAAPF